jgi:hypothetical protein
MRVPLSTLAIFGLAIYLFPIRLGAQGQQAPSPGSVEQLATLSSVVRFEGAESRNCPTGAGMFTLLGSRAIFTIPQIPPISKDRAIPTDIDSDFFGDSIFRFWALPDRTGERFEFIGRTCTVEITIRYR